MQMPWWNPSVHILTWKIKTSKPNPEAKLSGSNLDSDILLLCDFGPCLRLFCTSEQISLFVECWQHTWVSSSYLEPLITFLETGLFTAPSPMAQFHFHTSNMSFCVGQPLSRWSNASLVLLSAYPELRRTKRASSFYMSFACHILVWNANPLLWKQAFTAATHCYTFHLFPCSVSYTSYLEHIPEAHRVFPLSTAPAFTTFLFLCSPISPPRVQCPLRWGRMRWEESMWTKVNSTTKLHTEGNVLQAFISSLTTKLQHATPDSELPPPFSERHQALRCNDSGLHYGATTQGLQSYKVSVANIIVYGASLLKT